MVLKCEATSCNPSSLAGRFQDKTYGKGNRVHTPVKPPSGKVSNYRCTVCSHVRGPSAEEMKKHREREEKERLKKEKQKK